MSSSTWLDDQDTDYQDSYDDADSYLDDLNSDADTDSYYGDDSLDDGESSRAVRRARARRARARRARNARRAMARRALTQPRRRRYVAPTSDGAATTAQVSQGFERVGEDVTRTQAAVRDLDLESKVQADALGSALSAQGRRIGGTEAALAATTVVNQLQASFPNVVNDPIIKAGLPLAPLLFMKPTKRGSGVEGLASDPRILAGALVAGQAFFGNRRTTEVRTAEVQTFRIAEPQTELPQGGKARFHAEVRDGGGRLIGGQRIKWKSDPEAVVKVDPDTGAIQAGNQQGPATITAWIDGTTHWDEVTVRVT